MEKKLSCEPRGIRRVNLRSIGDRVRVDPFGAARRVEKRYSWIALYVTHANGKQEFLKWVPSFRIIVELHNMREMWAPLPVECYEDPT